MKNLFFLILLFSFQTVLSQDNESSVAAGEELIYNVTDIDVKAEFPGGMDKFYKYFMKNFVRPENRIPGKILLSFVIESDGSIKRVQVVKSDVDEAFENEAIRILKLSPKWIPAEKDGKKVRTLLFFPVNS
ncbi:MAG: energy transducer TonB [Flavobacterium sp.]|uniref:energy transducer TonB n=1 Tax=Flavobacterium sp. TaxID=239 RepID=UPI0032660E6B